MCAASGAILVGGGGIYDGRGIAACMALGAQGVWIGTRFLASLEANCNKGWHKQMLKAKSGDTRRIEIYTGRPLRVIKNKLNDSWAKREGEMRDLLASGIIPISQIIKDGEADAKTWFGGPLSRHQQGIGKRPEEGFWNDVRDDPRWNDDTDCAQAGQAVGAITSVPPAAMLVKSMMEELVSALQVKNSLTKSTRGRWLVAPLSSAHICPTPLSHICSSWENSGAKSPPTPSSILPFPTLNLSPWTTTMM
jgi:NAD(P)H-dependent flavin oxidoreductase YrpB (nitropropane dioxygenase family)